jgi:hypothetical protein
MAIGRLSQYSLVATCGLALTSALAQDTLTVLKNFEFGRSRRFWNTMDMNIRGPSNRDRRAAEEQLIQVLLGRDSTTDAKILACRGLRYVGTRSGVEVLLSLVKDERLSAETCAALQEKDFKEINPTLRTALPLASNTMKIVLMNTLARRRDRESVPIISKIARGLKDRKVFQAAIDALGQISGVEGLTALQLLTTYDATLDQRRKHALLAAASHAMRQDAFSKELALEILHSFTEPKQPAQLRGPAMVELAIHNEKQRASLCLQALKASPQGLLPSASSILNLLSVKEFKPLYATHFETLSLPAQTLLVELWNPAYRETKRIQDLSLNTNIDPKLRQAAVRAIDRNR